MISSSRHVTTIRGLAGCVGLAAVFVAATNAWVFVDSGPHAFRSLAAVPTKSVAIVPGAFVYKDRPARTLEDRLEAALELYRDGRVRTILVSGNDTATSPEVSVMRSWLLGRGVPEGAIWSDPRGTRTRETMENASKAFDVRDAVICTQAPYVHRSLFLAKSAGIDAVGVGVPSATSLAARGASIEAVKTAVAFVESLVRRGQSANDGVTAATVLLASR